MHETWINSIGMEFVAVPGGRFIMGSDSGRPNDPPHEVVVAGFWLGIFPVTQAQWNALGLPNHSRFKQPKNNPMESVSWKDAEAFITTLCDREGFRRYRLATEAEWEYACRAGGSGRYCFGDDPDRLGEYAWYELNAPRVQPVDGKKAKAKKAPNAWGLYHMHGNVWEWVEDRYEMYPDGKPPSPSWDGVCRVLRGGGWRSPAECCTSTFRVLASPTYWACDIGFRVAFSA